MTPSTVSLFCGAGGESLGKHLAFEELGLSVRDFDAHALNHWDLAVATHGMNFPGVQVHCEDITAVTAADFGLERINLLWASPSCVHHSRARGGKPREEQQRSHAWEVIDRWLKVAKVDVLLVENVTEFMDWGPLDEAGQPIKARKGEDFRAFVAALEGLGYVVEWRVLCAADYGDPTTRRRFFLQAVRDGLPIVWPEPSHRDPRKAAGLFDAALPPWRTAAECIDWSIPVPSIFDRKKPLAEATLRRIAAGVVRFVLQGRPFLVKVNHTAPWYDFFRGQSIDEPMQTVTAGGIDAALIAPTLIQTGYGEREGQAPRVLDLGQPLGTVVAGGPKHALVAAFLAKHYGGVVGQPVDQPAPTVTGVDHTAVVAATLMTNTTGHAPTDLRAPVPALTTGNHQAMIAASMIQMRGTEPGQIAASGRSLEQPLGTLTAGGGHQALVAAFIQHYYGTGGQHQATDLPLHTVTTLARHGLVTVEIDGSTYVVTDIGMRMLEPRELARAMGFPDWFRFDSAEGKPLTKRDTVKMIGNACPVNTVKALIKAVVLERPRMFGLRGVA